MKAMRLIPVLVVFIASLAAPGALFAQEGQGEPAGGGYEQPPPPIVDSPEGDAGDPGPAPAVTPAPPPAVTPAPASPPPPVSRATTSASTSVKMGDNFYSPATVSIDAGDTVLWTNEGKVPEGHTVTGDGFDSGVVKSGGTYSHTFSTAGTFPYICTLHAQMTGTVKVLASSSSGGGTGGGQGTGGGGGSDPTGTSSADPGGGSTTGTGSESAAVSSPDAAGSSSSLPATGLDTPFLAAIAGLLLGAGVALRRRASSAR